MILGQWFYRPEEAERKGGGNWQSSDTRWHHLWITNEESSQMTGDFSQAEEVIEDRKGRKKWTPQEDKVLISAWLNTSKDPIVGNEQKAEAFWKRIATTYAASPNLKGMPSREPNHCKQRWAKIEKGVQKFVGCFDAAIRDKSSGQNEDDWMKAANEMFFTDVGHKFTLEHAWRELRFDQKWCSSVLPQGQSKRRKFDHQSPQSSSTINLDSQEEEEAFTRPIGVKAAKAAKAAAKKAAKAAKEDKGKGIERFQRLWEIKMADLEMKEKLNKQKLLESLLLKTETLTDIELAFKNKLISDLM